jgi:hypothetical protein
MANNVAKLRDAKPPLSPERERLAEQIAEVARADDRRASLATATAAASDVVSNARAELHAATAGLDRARADMIEHSIAGGTAGAPMTIRDARNRLADAEDSLAIAIGVSDSLAAQVADVGTPDWARDRLRAAAFAVISTEAKPQAIVAAAELRRELAGRLAELEWLHLNAVLPRNTFGVPSDSSVSAGLVLLQSPCWADYSAAMAAGRARWETALGRLMADASAPLPE